MLFKFSPIMYLLDLFLPAFLEDLSRYGQLNWRSLTLDTLLEASLLLDQVLPRELLFTDFLDLSHIALEIVLILEFLNFLDSLLQFIFSFQNTGEYCLNDYFPLPLYLRMKEFYIVLSLLRSILDLDFSHLHFDFGIDVSLRLLWLHKMDLLISFSLSLVGLYM